MNSWKFVFYLSFILLCANAYVEIHDRNRILAYYEENSYQPIMHVYYNRHFSNSKQFNNFIDVIEEAELKLSEFSKIILTDCQKDKSEQNSACKQIKRLNQNRMIIGFQPSPQFTNLGDKIMQSPPTNRLFDHPSDIYQPDQIIRFVNQMMPSFYKEISNTFQFDEFKKPKYSPKLIWATREGDVPRVVRQLGVSFFLKFDMGYLEDLTQSVTNQLEINKFPSLLVLKHNYDTNKLEIFTYEGNDFGDDQFLKISKFLDKHALKEKRNDYVFHLMKNPQKSQLQIVDTYADYQQQLDRARGWVFVSQGPDFNRLLQLQQQYGLYYQYIHYMKPQSQPSLYLKNKRLDINYQYNSNQVQYKLMNAQDFQSNSTAWLRKDYVVVGVRQRNGHLCTVVDKALFSGLAHCFIIAEGAYQQVVKNMGITFEEGFVVSNQKGTTKVSGNQIKSTAFQDVYRVLQYVTRNKVKEIIDDFMDNPVKNLIQTTTIQSLCSQPFKKCIFYFNKNVKDQTNREYLQLEALNYVNEYKMFDINLVCNPHILEQIPQLQGKSSGLIAYHPRSNQYVFLKAKMTRSVIKKFLKINNQDRKSLPFRKFISQSVSLNVCQSKDNNVDGEL